MATLKDHELRELHQLMSQSQLILPYYDKFVAENISKDLLQNADENLLKLICDQFHMKLGEYAYLRIILRKPVPPSPLGSKMKKASNNLPEVVNDIENISSQASTSSASTQNTAESVQSQGQSNLASEVVDVPQNKEESKEVVAIQKKKDDEFINKEDSEEYKDNTIEKFKTGKHNL